MTEEKKAPASITSFALGSARERLRTLACAAALCAGISFLAVSPAPSSAAAGCPNEARRTEQGEPGRALPDCRAYEMVSPPGFEPSPFSGNEDERVGYEASITGERIAFYSKAGAPPGSVSFGPYFLSTRGSNGWSTENVIPPQSTAYGLFCQPWIFYSPDLSKGALEDGYSWGEGYPRYPDDNSGGDCSHDEPPLVEGEPRGAQNLFLRDNETASYQLVNVTPPGVPARNAWFQTGSDDFSHLVFTDPIPLTAEAPTPPEQVAANFAVGEDLYVWAGGVLRLVTILPGGSAVWGLLANGEESGAKAAGAGWTHAVSADGERVFFYAGGEVVPQKSYLGGNLYLRQNAARPRVEECATSSRACTVQVDAAQGGPESGEGHFQWATPDGSRAFFTDERKLTADSTAVPGKPDLYEYDLGKPEGERLTDLTVNAGEPADVQGLSGISDDGSYVYFVAEGDLSGEQANSHGDKAQAGKPNLYLRHAGAITFIARLDALGEDSQVAAKEGDTCDWDSFSNPGQPDLITQKGGTCMSARVTPDGAFLAFNSLRSLTGYDNVLPGTGLHSHEIFLYHAADNTLSCASCDPTGAPPTADPTSHKDPLVLGPMHEAVGVSHVTPTYLTRSLAGDGRVFFETTNRLLPADENGQTDVYEYQHGQLSLISTGKSLERSQFEDASAGGNDVFFLTTQALVNRDTDNTMGLYDAHVDGGFPEPPPPVVCESEEACHTEHQEPPPTSTPGTAHFESHGNELYCPKGFKKVIRHGKEVCVKVKRHKRHRNHKRHRRSHRRANLNRGGRR